MKNYNEYSLSKTIQLLAEATPIFKVRWVRLTDYLFYNGRNKAIVNYANMFSKADTPVMIDDVAKADLMKSYYCEYGSSAFCLMYCQQVLEPETSPKFFYDFMVQCTPYGNFGIHSTFDESYQTPLLELSKLIEKQITDIWADSRPLYQSLSALEADIASYDPFADPQPIIPVKHPRDTYKHSCVIDASGNYVTLVLVLTKNEKNEEIEDIQHYVLKAGERLLDVSPPGNFIKARWNGSSWEEAASQEEKDAYHRSHRF